MVAPPLGKLRIWQVEGKHDDGLADLGAAIEADAEQVVVLAEPDGVVSQDVAHENQAQNRRREQIRRLVDREERGAVHDDYGIAARLELPLRLPEVHEPDEKAKARTDQKGPVEPVIGRRRREEDLGP